MFVFLFFPFCQSKTDLHLGCFLLQALMDDEQAEEFGTQDFKTKLRLRISVEVIMLNEYIV